MGADRNLDEELEPRARAQLDLGSVEAFDAELADLLVEAGCRGVSMSAEFMCREHLAVWTPPSGRIGPLAERL